MLDRGDATFDPLELSAIGSPGWWSVMVEPGDGVPGVSPETLTVLNEKFGLDIV